MKDPRVARKAVCSGVPAAPCDSLFDEMGDEKKKQTDPEIVAKEITDPLIESMRKELDKIDVTAFKK